MCVICLCGLKMYVDCVHLCGVCMLCGLWMCGWHGCGFVCFVLYVLHCMCVVVHMCVVVCMTCTCVHVWFCGEDCVSVWFVSRCIDYACLYVWFVHV